MYKVSTFVLKMFLAGRQNSKILLNSRNPYGSFCLLTSNKVSKKEFQIHSGEIGDP